MCYILDNLLIILFYCPPKYSAGQCPPKYFLLDSVQQKLTVSLCSNKIILLFSVYSILSTRIIILHTPEFLYLSLFNYLSFIELLIAVGPGGPSQRRRCAAFATLRPDGLKNVQLSWSQLHEERDALERVNIGR